jgi:DNA mismatch repair protein MutS
MNYFRLLWPDSVSNETINNGERFHIDVLRDLNVEGLLQQLDIKVEERKKIGNLLSRKITDEAVISYRQELFEDLYSIPEVVECFTGLQPYLDNIFNYIHDMSSERPFLFEVTDRLTELKDYIHCVEELTGLFKKVGDRIGSRALCDLRDYIALVEEDETYNSLREYLPGVLAKVRSVSSLTIGVNLDSALHPEEIVLLDINTDRVTNDNPLARLIDKSRHILGMGRVFKLDEESRDLMRGDRYILNSTEKDKNALIPMFQSIERMMFGTIQPAAFELKRFSRINTRMFANIRDEVQLCLVTLRLVNRLQELGMSVCRPEIAPREERTYRVTGNYNIHLALHMGKQELDVPSSIIPNDIELDDDGRIVILTGPNQGGKTTCLQCIGLSQLFAQAGLFAPGTSARISLVDNILTHYPIEERSLQNDSGRLGDEAIRFREIFEQVTPYSLILMNESLSTTSAGESLYIARDVVKVLRMIGARAVFATHLHELAAIVDRINDEVEGGSRVVSMVSQVDESVDEDGLVKRTYKIVKSPPRGESFARQIAEKHGISFNQLCEYAM